MAPNITRQNPYLVTSGISYGSQLLQYADTLQIRYTQICYNVNRAKRKSGVRQGTLYRMSFKLGPIVFELGSNTTQSFVELWLSLMTAWCGKYLTFIISTFSVTPCSN